MAITSIHLDDEDHEWVKREGIKLSMLVRDIIKSLRSGKSLIIGETIIGLINVDYIEEGKDIHSFESYEKK